MSNRKLLITAILITGAILIQCKKESDQPPTDGEILGNVIKPEIIDEYIYPIQPGTPEWAAFTNHDEMLEACQLPDAVLKSISTWGLVQTCFNYPLYGDYSAFNQQARWINDLSQSFNGLRELFSRTDAPIVLLYDYRYMDLSKYPEYYDWNFMELMIGCDSFVSRLNNRQRLYLVSVAIEKDKEQRDFFNTSFPPYSVYIMANAMTYAGYQPFINYCIKQKDNNMGELALWGFNASAEKIEEYAREFVNI